MADNKDCHTGPAVYLGEQLRVKTMIHMTTFKTPNGSTLGAMIEARHGNRVQFTQSFSRKDAGQAPKVLGYLTNDESPHYLGQTGVVHKTETVSLRSWYGISN